MNQFETFSIGFGNDRGQTSVIILQQKMKKIELASLKPTQLQNPKIQVRKFNPIVLGPLQDCIRKKRDRNVLEDLLMVKPNCNVDKISEQCKALQNKIANDMALLGVMMQEDNSTQKFIQQTKASGKDAQKYLSTYKNLENAVNMYQKHQQLIKKFMQQNNCNRENAILFLQSNNYDSSLFF